MTSGTAISGWQPIIAIINVVPDRSDPITNIGLCAGSTAIIPTRLHDHHRQLTAGRFDRILQAGADLVDQLKKFDAVAAVFP